MNRIRSAAAIVLALLLAGLTAGPAYADHETRNQVLSETGIDVVFLVIVALVLLAAMVVLAAFAAAILAWERRDAEAARRAQSQAAEREGRSPPA